MEMRQDCRIRGHDCGLPLLYIEVWHVRQAATLEALLS